MNFFCNHLWTNNLFKYHNKIKEQWQFLAIGCNGLNKDKTHKHNLFCKKCGLIKDFGVTYSSSNSFKLNYPKKTIDLINMFNMESKIGDLYNKCYPNQSIEQMNTTIQKYRDNVENI